MKVDDAEKEDKILSPVCTSAKQDPAYQAKIPKAVNPQSPKPKPPKPLNPFDSYHGVIEHTGNTTIV